LDVCGARLYEVANLQKPGFVAGSGQQMPLRSGLRAMELLRSFPEVARQQMFAMFFIASCARTYWAVAIFLIEIRFIAASANGLCSSSLFPGKKQARQFWAR
jgi:hypothetical protein